MLLSQRYVGMTLGGSCGNVVIVEKTVTAQLINLDAGPWLVGFKP